MNVAGALEAVSLLVITGTMGAGKSAVLAEASDLLAVRQVEHAAIDVDALALAYITSQKSDDLMYANLEGICRNYAQLGVRRFLLAGAVEDRPELERCRLATSATAIVVCRLTGDIATLRQRVMARETGIRQGDYVARVERLNAILDGANLEHFRISNQDRPVTDVAHELLVRAGWLSG